MANDRKYVIVRTYSAGVHAGELVERNGKEVLLANARRIWNWQGCWTLNEVAVEGLDPKKSRVGALVSEILVTEAIEVITCNADGRKAIEAAKWAK